MFSGIVECSAQVVALKRRAGVLQLDLKKPINFDDLNIGDSIAVNGVCLTLENFTESELSFALAAETLQITGWNEEQLVGKTLNLERSLRLGDRIHGHLVAGHVDGLGVVVQLEKMGESCWLTISANKKLRPYLWSKGSVAVNGVSLTINECNDATFTLCLIPETIKRTNLGQLKIGDQVNLEADLMARGIVSAVQERGAPPWL